jgi:3-keto-disaccharide hydrolase
MRYWTIVSVAAAVSLAVPAGAQNSRALFDGKTLNGWEPHGAAEDWQVKDGTLACAATRPSWLGTAASFSNYVLELEFRGAEKVNSGVFLRSQKEGQPHLTGYELQIWDYQPAGFNTGSLVGTAKAEPVKILPDQWNQYRITADGDHFVIVLNGKTLLDTHDSKHAAGVIGFQCQPGNPIAFRNVKLREIGK